LLLAACRAEVGGGPEERILLKRREGFGSESINEFFELSGREDVDVAVRLCKR
jgi:hypothetical protein